MAAAFPNLDALIAALPGQPIRLCKIAFTGEGTGTWHSLWRVGGLPGAAATPPSGNGEIPTKSTLGTPNFSNAAGGNKLHVGRATVSGGSVGTLTIYDRLWHNSGFVGNTTSAQTIASPPTLTRPDALGVGVELWLEVYSAMGATAATFTTTYVNQDGTSGQLATYTMPSNALTAGQMAPFALAAGDTGVRSVSQVQLSGSTAGVGDFGLTLLRRIIDVPVLVAGSGRTLDFGETGLVNVDNDACLAAMWFLNSTSTNPIQAFLQLVES